eukprot:scaffold20500_cov62-Phaeocystis_antarctica.AAC.1
MAAPRESLTSRSSHSALSGRGGRPGTLDVVYRVCVGVFNPGPSPGNGGELETTLSLLARNLAR